MYNRLPFLWAKSVSHSLSLAFNFDLVIIFQKVVQSIAPDGLKGLATSCLWHEPIGFGHVALQVDMAFCIL